MSQTKQTLEMRVLRKVRELALERGDLYIELEIGVIAGALELSPKRMKTATQQLCHGNFLKKCSATSVRLSPHGNSYLEATD